MGSIFYKESSRYFWETIVTVRYSYKINFPATTKNWHNRTTVLYTKYVRNTKTICHQNQKKNKIRIEQENSFKINFPTTKKKYTTAQLYCTLSMYVTPETISPQNQKN